MWPMSPKCTLVHIHPRRNVYVSDIRATHTRQGDWAYPVSCPVHILATTTQVQEPPGAHQFKGVGRSVHIRTHTHCECEQCRKGWRSGGTNGTRDLAAQDPRKSAEVQGNSHGISPLEKRYIADANPEGSRVPYDARQPECRCRRDFIR